MKTAKAVIGILSITMALLAQAGDPSFLTNGLVAYFPLDGDANDATGNGNNGTPNGTSPTLDRYGKPDSALWFNGLSDYVWVPHQITTNQPLTWSIWFKLDDGATNRSAALLNEGAAPGVHGMSPVLWINQSHTNGLSDDNVPGQIQFYTNPGGPNYRTLSYTRSHWATNKWYHVVATSDGNGNRCLYVDGTMEGTATGQPFGGGADFQFFYVGALPEDHKDYFAGSIDDIRIYNRALSANEVAQVYALESGPRVGLIKAVKPLLTQMWIGTNYQLQVSSDMSNWTNQGSPFTATNSTMVYPQYWDCENWSCLFFRVRTSP